MAKCWYRSKPMLLRGHDRRYTLLHDDRTQWGSFFAANWNQTKDADQDLCSTEIQAYNTPNLEKMI